MASIPIDLLLSLHKVDDRLLVLFSEYYKPHHESPTIVIYAPSAQLSIGTVWSMSWSDSTAVLYFKPSHERSGAADLSL